MKSSKKSNLDKVLGVSPYIIGLFFGVILFYIGKTRISSGISTLRISDSYTSHYMNVGLLYVQISTLILIFIAIGITYSLMKKNKTRF
jgi:hypothetical protein